MKVVSYYVSLKVYLLRFLRGCPIFKSCSFIKQCAQRTQTTVTMKNEICLLSNRIYYKITNLNIDWLLCQKFLVSFEIFLKNSMAQLQSLQNIQRSMIRITNILQGPRTWLSIVLHFPVKLQIQQFFILARNLLLLMISWCPLVPTSKYSLQILTVPSMRWSINKLLIKPVEAAIAFAKPKIVAEQFGLISMLYSCN